MFLINRAIKDLNNIFLWIFNLNFTCLALFVNVKKDRKGSMDLFLVYILRLGLKVMQRRIMKDVVGAHISIGKGFAQAVVNAEAINATAMQIFTKSNRQWYAKKIGEKERENFKIQLKKSQIRTVVVHASYLINLASTCPDMREKSIKGLIVEIERCALLDIPYLVLHPGSALKGCREQALKFVAEGVNQAFEETKDAKVVVSLETMAGSGSEVGSSFEEITAIINKVKNKDRIGVTIDTCHIFSAGYDLRTTKACEQTFDLFEKVVGMKYLKVIHFNDSKKMLNAHIDRHESLGKGMIGIDCFRYIVRNKSLISIPKILETPDPDQYESEIAQMRSWISEDV